MADIVLGYVYEKSTCRYRNLTDGRFVSANTMTALLEAQVATTEARLGALATAAHRGDISPAYFAEQARTELRRSHLAQRALGRGGIPKLTSADFGATGQKLRDNYARVANLAQGLADGTVTLPQALQRVNGYAGSARLEYYEARNISIRESGQQWEQRRVLHAAESCATCIELEGRGWQEFGLLPVPGSSGTICGIYCKCTMDERRVEVNQ